MGKYYIDEFAKVFERSSDRELEFRRLLLNELAETNRLETLKLLMMERKMELDYPEDFKGLLELMHEQPKENQFDESLRDLAAD